MIRRLWLTEKMKSPASRKGSRTRRQFRFWGPEGLEARCLLSGNPTVYTVNNLDSGLVGVGTAGSLPFVISLANTNPNSAGSLIQFDPTVFATPQTIVLAERWYSPRRPGRK